MANKRNPTITGRILALIDVDILKKRPTRLLWGALHCVVICISIGAIHSTKSFLLQIFFGVVIGHSLGVLSFLGHEILHGSVVGKGTLCSILGGICFAHFGMLPSVWVKWHNNLHHRHTQNALKDPDCFGYINGNYKYSRWYRILERFLPGSKTIQSYLFLFAGFSLQVVAIIFQRSDILKITRERTLARCYFFTVYAGWFTCAIMAFGIAGICFCLVLPLMLANFLMMSYIATNHLLSPLSDEKPNPLWNTLTVRSPRWVEDLHLQFGYHVEHHFFPSASPYYARHIRGVLLQIDPSMYMEMSHIKAIKHLYNTPRFYRDESSLINPITKDVVGTLHSGHFGERIR